jgi:hypothetical protein
VFPSQAATPQELATQSLLELRDGIVKVLPDYLALQDKLNNALALAFKALGLTPQTFSKIIAFKKLVIQILKAIVFDSSINQWK